MLTNLLKDRIDLSLRVDFHEFPLTFENIQHRLGLLHRSLEPLLDALRVIIAAS